MQVAMLNFYSRKHLDFQHLIDKIDTASLVDTVNDKLLTHDIVTKPIESIGESIERIEIDDSVRYDAKYEDKEREERAPYKEPEEVVEYSRVGRYNVDEKPREYMRRY